jgi:hypothetical protein
MAAQWGNNTLGSKQAAAWFFVRGVASNFLPILSVIPLSPSFTDDSGTFYWTTFDDGIAFPITRQLGTSTIWAQLTDDSSALVYFMLVLNYSDNTIEYAFLESDL